MEYLSVHEAYEQFNYMKDQMYKENKIEVNEKISKKRFGDLIHDKYGITSDFKWAKDENGKGFSMRVYYYLHFRDIKNYDDSL
ncbi:MAG: hypothetical protein LBB45_06015 [Methanobrevibacter sp.]|jgi:spore coat polysaccharide biosynthesis predicted glycosyltransferase SpsG|nr:hypothetical protein [Candidatus Methanovirga basalitermitum]